MLKNQVVTVRAILKLSSDHIHYVSGEYSGTKITYESKSFFVSHGCWSWGGCGNLCHSSFYVILEGSDVAFFLYNDAERHSQGDVPSSLFHHYFGQISLLLHLKA